MLFGGAIGGLSRILGMIPGPIGKIGYGIRIAQMVGSSLLAYNNMRKAQNPPSPDGEIKKSPDMMDSIKGAFKNRAQTGAPIRGNPLDIHLSIALPPLEALAGTRKKLSYKVGDQTEHLLVPRSREIPRQRQVASPGQGKRQKREAGGFDPHRQS